MAVVTPSDALVQAARDFVAADLPNIAKLNEETFGVTNGHAKIDHFQSLVENGTGLVDGIDATDPDAVAELFRANIFGDIDTASYGL